ncbi:DUF6223 family protein [Nocardia fluminea]|uniref:Tryptophan-associated transmembrane protein n=1 Tax=Nocardia fluminea TaxID=134984 RepID=A0A2N3V4R8_9NOCA|nr:DUF6223 family protein [Nocardia fluminea]PKV76622.1 hypothetical protein ATK86_7558 [Nocardia fluminea]
MSIRPLTAAAVSTALTLVLAAPATAATTTLADSYGMTTDRLVATSAAFLGLAAVIVGCWAVSRAGSPARSFVAIGAGAVAAIVGAIGFATADGGPGTGNGIVGAAIAIVLGLAAVALGTRAHLRAHR